MKISILTLGCKVNEYESLSMASQLIKLGHMVTDKLEVADCYILNTCAVTNMAERKSRQMISKIKKVSPQAQIVVCGCASQHNHQQFADYEGVVSVIGNNGKENIIEYINNSYKGDLHPISCEYQPMEYATKTKTRHYIKVQDGCNNFCSYCIIPYTRGRSRSRDLQDILEEIKSVDASEIVVTGINVSDYRINGKLALIDLLEAIDKLNIRFRLSSLECVIVTDEFLARLAKLNNFCPFFHLSLQSACNETLKRMNRHYTIEEYMEVCKKVKEYFPNSSISTDLIVGFKGETDEEFATTFENLQKIPFAFMHIFPYSVREGTNAEKMSGNVSNQSVKSREQQLIIYNNHLKWRFAEQHVGKKLKVLVEESIDGFSCGYSENYLYCYIDGQAEEGKIVDVIVKSPFRDGVLCQLVDCDLQER